MNDLDRLSTLTDSRLKQIIEAYSNAKSGTHMHEVFIQAQKVLYSRQMVKQ